MLRGDKVVILHDSFAPYEEAQSVVEQMAQVLPYADVVSTLSMTPSARTALGFRKVSSTGAPDRLESLARNRHPLRPFLIRSLDVKTYSVVITSCAGLAKSAECSKDAVHICYCHGPSPAIWRSAGPEITERARIGGGFFLRPLRAGLRQMDLRASAHPDYYITSSYAAASQIKRCYGRNAVVIPPPIDIGRFRRSPVADDYYLVVSPLDRAKRVDMIIAACNSTGRRLLILGDGPDRQRLEALAGPAVEFLGQRPESELADLLSRCAALVCPDIGTYFDTLPLKANASGRPVIAFAAGSALESVVDGESGVLYWECSRPAIVDAMRRCDSLEWDQVALRAYARDFDGSMFRRRFAAVLEDLVGIPVVTTGLAA
jgi:glycosyltransferase involved in cell wall biosynthesis